VFLGGCSHAYLKGEFREWGEERGRRREGFVFLYFTWTDTIHRMSE
jgi:hypothetical protein